MVKRKKKRKGKKCLGFSEVKEVEACSICELQSQVQTFPDQVEKAETQGTKRSGFSEVEEVDACSICELRAYQQCMVDSIMEENAIVLLPTGAGKTLIAAECAKQMGKTLFLVPTCMLVEQQAAAIRNWTGLRVAECSGESQALPQSFDVLVCTPEYFQNAQLDPMNSFLSWENFKLVVFDEVHHVLKKHPYRELAVSLKDSTAESRVLGLSASLTYEVDPVKIERQIQQLCSDLCICEIATATDAQLKESGYHASEIHVEVRLPTLEQPVNYLPIAERRSHDMRGQFFERINSGTATAFASALMDVIRKLEAVCASIYPTFKSPLMEASPLAHWGRYALSFGTASDCAFSKELSIWYEALRLLVVSFEDAEDAVSMFLRMRRLDSGKKEWEMYPAAAEARATFFNTILKTSFPRMENFKDCLRKKLHGNKDFRCIVFVDQRITTHILVYVISTDPELSGLIRSRCLYATGKPASASLKALTKTDVTNRVSAFASGEANMLIATVAAEEGMDIPAANCVIRFDSMVHSVSMVQGRGRARQAESSMTVLSERSDRTVAKLMAMEKLQQRIVSNIQPDTNHHAADEKKSPFTVLNEYSQKTNGDLSDFTDSDYLGGWRCKLVYTSKQRQCFRESTGRSKKEAKAAAAVQLLQALKCDE